MTTHLSSLLSGVKPYDVSSLSILGRNADCTANIRHYDDNRRTKDGCKGSILACQVLFEVWINRINRNEVCYYSNSYFWLLFHLSGLSSLEYWVPGHCKSVLYGHSHQQQASYPAIKIKTLKIYVDCRPFPVL